jgi:hypothetical protein
LLDARLKPAKPVLQKQSEEDQTSDEARDGINRPADTAL